MKTLTMHSMFAVAALAVAAVSASAQTYNAQVPMSFRVGDKLMGAGTYQFHVALSKNGQSLVTVRNAATNRSALVVAAPGKDAPKAWRTEGSPVIAFDCLGDNCALRQLWNGSDVSTYSFPGLKLPKAETERIASITVALTKGD